MHHRPSRIFFPAIALLLLAPTGAWANIPIPGGFGFLAPFWLSSRTMGLVFGGIVVLEALVAHYFVRMDWKNSFLLALVANTFSSTLGLLMAEKSFFLLCFLVVLLIAVNVRGPDHWRGAWRASVVGFGIAFVTLIVSYAIAAHHPAVAIFGSLVPAFFVTVLIERPLWMKYIEKRAAFTGALLANGASYAVLVLYLLLSGTSWMDTPLASPDYFGMQAAAAVREGDLDAALQRLHWARSAGVRHAQRAFPPESESEPYKNYYPWSESRVVRAMMDGQHYKEAQSLLSETMQLPGLQKSNAELFDLPELLEQCNRKMGIASPESRSASIIE